MDSTEPRVRRQRRRTLTDAMVIALPRRPGRTYYSADPEMPKHGVRVRPIGPHTYTVICRDPHGRQKWTKIGMTSEMTIAQAREKAREVIRRIEAGLEPFEAPKARPDSVEDVAANWLARHVERNALRSAGELRRIVTKYILPNIGKLNFIDLRRKRISELLDLVEDQHGARQADAVLSVLSSMASFVLARDEDYKSPFVRGMRRVPKGERTRSRKLDDDELRAVWAHAESAGDFGAFVKLLLLTAQRFEKVRDIRWTDLDRKASGPSAPNRAKRAISAKCACPMPRCESSMLSRALTQIRTFLPAAVVAGGVLAVPKSAPSTRPAALPVGYCTILVALLGA